MNRKVKPTKGGLYDPRFEHDSCGVGFVVDIEGKPSNRIVRQGLEILMNLRHRGAKGAEANTGDGAGILLQIPHAFFEQEFQKDNMRLPAPGEYGVGMVFLPSRDSEAQKIQSLFEDAVYRSGQILLGWRDVPTDNSPIGASARSAEPRIRQVFIGRGEETEASDLERKLLLLRKRAERAVRESSIPERDAFYVASLSSRTIAYKGMLSAEQTEVYFPDLQDPQMTSALALVHQRFSTNTFPSWPLAQPFRYLAHNGEINTLRGNINWMRAREGLFRSELFGDDLCDLFPVVIEGGSDSAIIDNALEMLMLCGRSLPHAVMMLIPEAWDGHESMSEEKKAFYEYHACLMEPWDGPASIAFTDGAVIGAVLDRNGLRPSRYYVTTDGMVVMASEVGVLDIPPERVERKGRLEPGKMFLIDTEQGRIIDDRELKHQMATDQPYREWLDAHMVSLGDLPDVAEAAEPDHATVICRQQIFGYTHEDLRILMAPMAVNGGEGLGSMGNDTPLAVLSDSAPSLFSYFKQLFAQVTNPPLDAIREELVTSTISYIGAERNLIDPEPESAKQIRILSPILDNAEFRKLQDIDLAGYKSRTLSMLFPARDRGEGLEREMEALCNAAAQAVDDGVNILILSDRGVDREQAPIPSLLATAGVHHHLVREGRRTRTAIIVETGEAREVHHYCLLMGYGATAISPYLAFETLDDMVRQKLIDISPQEAVNHYMKAVKKGIVKVMSKMGISTLQSYRGAQIFEALGLNHTFVDRYFTWTASRIEGIGLTEIAEEILEHHRRAFADRSVRPAILEWGGQYQWRREGEYHMYNPETIHLLQYSTRTNDYKAFKKFSGAANATEQKLCTLRGLLDFKFADTPLSLDEVEPVDSIVTRFATGAMSFGSISKEAHETLAIAMNRLGGKSNTGEGGEDPARFVPDVNGDSRCSAIKQVASGRFGVTSEYLVSAQELQIKMAQGAKPGEGGQLPGYKVDKNIARVRHSTPGVGLISPPPHHDIYSIEDLAQLIFDLKNANPRARISVKLVSEVGVGTVAAGVAKAHSDVVLISGDSGGTGASPLTSLKHAGIPWELGLAETHQVLVANDLRSRITVQTDGQMKTGRDVVVAALLGAEEFGIATAALVVTGCIMMRVCHLNTCPVGIATQDPSLRAKYAGDAAHVVNYFRFLAEEVRELMAQLGFRMIDEMVGRMDRLHTDRAIDHWKGKKLDLSALLEAPEVPSDVGTRKLKEQDHGIDDVLDRKLIELAHEALKHKRPVEIRLPIRNSDRTTGTILGSEVTRAHGADGLPEDTIGIHFKGSAGQSFAAFVPAGMTLTLEGDANDYLAKGLSGGRVIVFPSKKASFVSEENVIVGNVVLYGATGGEVFIRGLAGERFCVRNSGAITVVEGVGDHGCEYMTGGRVVVLGPSGRNFAAGMSGGIAYVLDRKGDFATRCNLEMVDLEHFEGPAEESFVRYLIERHVNYTDSDYARDILDAWEQIRMKFVKVMPLDYRRVLDEQKGGRGDSIEVCSMADPRGFLEIARITPDRRPVGERLKDWSEVYRDFPQKELRQQAARCMDCGIPFCHDGCPLGNIIPDWNDLVYRDHWREAIERLSATNNFPEFTGRLCPAPCEGSCVLGINDDPVTIKQIEVTIIERAFDEGWIVAEPPTERTGKKVAVVGSGPAGLAAADLLNRAGHSVTVLERDDRIGGLLRYGIPEFKMEKRIVDRRLRLMEEEGVVFQTNANVGVNIETDTLRREYDAIVLARRCDSPRNLPVPGRELDGIHFAMEYLPMQNKRCEGDVIEEKDFISASGKRVVIIGGGDTGADCLGTAHRQGATAIHQLELLDRPPDSRGEDNPWPRWPNIFRTTSAHEEGGVREFNVSTKSFTGGDGRVERLHGVKVSIEKDTDGRFNIEELPNSEFEIQVDLVLLAMGFLGPQKEGMLSQLGVDLDARGNVIADSNKMTNVEGVFAAGDMARGQSLIVWAIHEGREAARGTDKYLMGSTEIPALNF